MSLLNDILNHKIKTNDTPKTNDSALKQILNHQISQNTLPNGVPQRSIFASRSDSAGSPSLRRKITTPDIKQYETKYRQEIENRDKLQEAIKNNLKNQGIAVTVDPFSTNRINTTEQIPMNSIQNQRFEAINPYANLKADVENKQKYNEIKQTEEYKNQMEQLREASNKVGYAKYNLDAARVANDNIGWYDKTIGNVLGGIGNVFDYTGGLIQNENGDTVYLPSRSELKHQKVQKSYDTRIGRFLGEAGYNVGRIGGSTLLNAVIPYAGSTAYFGKMFQENRDNAVLEGYDGGDATVYALANVAGEVITGKLLGSATKGLTGGKTSGYEELLRKLVGKFTQNPLIISFLAGAGSEATEEFIQEYADNLMKLALLDKSTNGEDYLNILTDTDILADAAYSAGIGALTGGLMNPFQVDSNTQQSAFDEFKQQLIERRKNAKTEAEVKAIDNTIKKIDELSNMSEEELIDLAKEKGLVQEQQEENNKKDNKVNKYKEQLKEIRKEQTKVKKEINEEVETTTKAKKEIKQEEPPKAKVSKPLNFGEGLTDYEVEDILQQINSYDQKQTQHNLVATERYLESGTMNPKVYLAHAALMMKDTNQKQLSKDAIKFIEERAESHFNFAAKKMNDADKFYVYRNLDKTNSKLAEIAEKYFAPTKQETTKTDEQKQQEKENLKAKLKTKAKELNDFVEKNQIGNGGLTEESGTQYRKLHKQVSDLEYKLETEYFNEISEKNIKDDRQTGFDKDVYVQARKDDLANKNIYDALTDASAGVNINADTKVDDILNGKNKKVSPRQLYDAFENTREKLREKYGDKVTLYRVETRQKEKATKNYGSSIEYTKSYGDNVKKYSVPVDDIVAVFTNRKGTYEDIIVATGGIGKYIPELNEGQKQIKSVDKVSEQSKLTAKSTSNIKKDIKSVASAKTKSPSQNIDEGNITITKNGISPNIDERMQDNVLRITTPTENPETIDIGKYKVKKPSAKEASKSMSERIQKAINNLSEKEKLEVNEERRKKRAAFKKAQTFAKNTNNKELSDHLAKEEAQAYYNQLDISANFLENVNKAYEDIDAVSEDFDVKYLDTMAGTPDGNPLLVSNELIAEGQGLLTYYLDKNMLTEATDVIVKLSKLGTASGQASAQFNAMYQYTPYGIYSQTVTMMEQAYNQIAARKGINSKWAKENNPNTNPNSKFRLTKEQADYILHESSELFDLHGKDWKQYCARKGLLQNYIGDIIPHGGAEGFTNWIRTSLLLGTRTIFKNSGSNIIDAAYHAENKINYTIYDKAVSNVFGTGVRTAGISMAGQKAGFKAGVKTSIESLNDIIHGTNTSEFGNRYMDSNQSRDNITKDFFGTMPNRYQTKIRKLNEVGNWLSQLANNTMTWGDAKFAASSYTDNRLTLRKLNALEQHKANPSKNIIYDITVDDAGTSHVDYISTNGQYASAITNDIKKFTEEKNMVALKGGDRIDKLALEYSQSRTYTGDTSFSKVTNSILHTINEAASRVPVLKQLGIKPTNFIVPFSKIGSNLCYKMYRGSILSIPSIKIAYDNFKTEVDAGQVSIKTQYELVSRLGDLTTGTILYAIMGSLAKAAFNNVEADDDDDESAKVSKFMKSVFGKEKYTFKVGDYNFSFDVGGNLTNMLKLSLDLQEVSDKDDAKLKDYVEVAFKDILSEWTVSNITNLFNEQYNSKALDNILQTIARIPSMAIPSFMKDVAVNIDNFTQRSVWDEDILTYALNSVKAKIPFARGTLPEKVDSWGDAMKVGDNLITQVWNTYISGDQIKKETSDPVSQELMNIYLITDTSSVLPNVSKSSFSYNSTKYELNDEEEKQYLQVYAKSAHDNLDKLFKSSQYQDADTETKLKYIDEIYTFANDEAKKDYLNRRNIPYYNYGKKVVIVGQNDSYEQARILDSIDQNISYDATIKYQDDSEKFKYYQSFGSYEIYKSAIDNIDDIRTTYSKAKGYSDAERKQQVINYVNTLNNLSAVQKAILIKQRYPSAYKSYNEQIKAYLKKQDLDDETYNKILKDLGVIK